MQRREVRHDRRQPITEVRLVPAAQFAEPHDRGAQRQSGLGARGRVFDNQSTLGGHSDFAEGSSEDVRMGLRAFIGALRADRFKVAAESHALDRGRCNDARARDCEREATRRGGFEERDAARKRRELALLHEFLRLLALHSGDIRLGFCLEIASESLDDLGPASPFRLTHVILEREGDPVTSERPPIGLPMERVRVGDDTVEVEDDHFDVRLDGSKGLERLCVSSARHRDTGSKILLRPLSGTASALPIG